MILTLFVNVKRAIADVLVLNIGKVFYENICKVTVKKSQVIESFKIELRDKGCSYVTHLRSIANINHWKVSHGQLTVYCSGPLQEARPQDLGLTWILEIKNGIGSGYVPVMGPAFGSLVYQKYIWRPCC